MSVPDQVDRPDLMYPPFQPGLPKVLTKRYDIFASIRKQDILMHHPFQSSRRSSSCCSRRPTIHRWWRSR
jgi:polyphosphate kinase